jgi:hypothetical protein
MKMKKFFLILFTIFFLISSISAKNLFLGSLSGNAFNESMGGNAIAYPWANSQTNLINPAFSAYQNQIKSFSFFNFSYFTKNKDKKSFSWVVTLEELASYGYIQNRYKGIKDKKLMFSIPTGKYLSHGLTLKWRERDNDIDTGLDLGGLLTISTNFALGWHIENIYPPTINTKEEPWVASAGLGFKPYKKLGISLNVKTGETFDEKYSGGIEIKPNEKYSLRTAVDEEGKIVLGNTIKINFGFLSLAYKYDENSEKTGFFFTFCSNFDTD